MYYTRAKAGCTKREAELHIDLRGSKRIKAYSNLEAEELTKKHDSFKKGKDKSKRTPSRKGIVSRQEPNKSSLDTRIPTDSLQDLTQFLVRTLQSAPTPRSQLCNISGKDRRRISTVLSVLKGVGLVDDVVSEFGTSKVVLDGKQLEEVSEDTTRMTKYFELKRAKCELEKRYEELLSKLESEYTNPSVQDFPEIDDDTTIIL